MGHGLAMLQLALLAMLLAAGTGMGEQLQEQQQQQQQEQWESTSYAGSKSPTHELPRPLTPPMELQHESGRVARNPRSRRPTLMDVALQQSVQQGLNAMAELYGKIQPQMLLNGQTLEENHPAALLSRFNAPIGESERREMAAYATIEATKAFRNNFQHIDELARQSHAHKISLRRTALEGLCPVRDPPPCMPAAERYRTHDGTCNNKRRPRWGAAQMPFNRFLPPEYGDGVDSVRSAADGSTLSSSRFVSLLVHGAREGEAPLTLMIAQWGQLLDHDMTSTAQPRAINGSIPSCCGGQDFHPSCFPIKVPLDDPWLSPLKVRCLEFLRSAPAQRRDCVLSWREQTNQATSYIDASPIYSNSAKSSDNARVFRNGLLIYGRGNPAEDVCQRGAIATQCIRSGDGRSGEQPGLLAMHHVWVGEHNRIAMELSEMNPHWSDEKLYQETRRIVGAMFQHITYREFLPVILGTQVCQLFDLQLLSTGFYENYDPKVNPTVANAFSSAAFRFGHSLVQNSYMRCDRHHNVINNNVSLHEEFQTGDIGTAGSLHRLLRGMALQRALKRDEFITPELTNHLFQTPGFPFGLDLAAINIQRGRDHGLAPYTSWRVPCGLSPIQSWDDFANVVGPESAKRIGHAYRSVHDIDLFVGGIAERPVVGGLVGPTFACIIAQQFSNARRGDRFWYENGGFESSFTPAQLHSLRRVSLAQVLCRAVGGGTFQPHIFIPPEFTQNERQTCGTGILTSIDLSPWLEQDPFLASNQAQPDHVFNIVPGGAGDPLSATPIIKEDKAGFSNRIKPVVVKPHVDLRPNSAAGFQRPPAASGQASKVNDKLDLKRKTLTTNKTNRTPTPTRKTQTANGISNKLEKSPKITININNVITRKPAGGASKRTVIINNVPIELRHAEDGNVTTTTTTTTTTLDNDLAEFRAQDKGQQTGDNSTLTETTNRTQRDVLEPKRNSVADPRLLRNRTMTKTTQTTTTAAGSSTSGSASPGTSRARTSRTTKSSKLSRTTKRNVELRSQQYAGLPGRPVYPQKVLVNGPSGQSDQYEIEINIRQTNKSPVQRPDYSDYTTSTVYRPFYGSYENSYAPHYMDYGSTTPAYAYAYAAPHRDPSTVQKTKPPTIIYLNDSDDRRTTTRPPNIFQNFLNFATNGLNPHGNRRPTVAPESSPISSSSSSSSSGHKEQRPLYVETPLSGGSTSSVYAPRPSSHAESYPISTSTHIGSSLSSSSSSGSSSGYLHASSSGHFGSISGVASANGADSTFSFNIRPRPESVPNPVFSSYPRPQNLPQAGGSSYGLVTQSPYKPDYPHSQPELYYDRELISSSPSNASPFSSGSSGGYRPQTQTQYYGRAPELKEVDTPSTDHKLDIRDYDYLSRTLMNDTADESRTDTKDADDYVDYDEDEPNNKHIDFMKLAKQTDNATSSTKTYDKDGLYIRAQMMTDNLGGKRTLNDSIDTNTNGTYLDDNYVLPVLARNETQTVCATEMPRPLLSTSMRSTVNSKVTVFPDSVAKQLGGDILADTLDYDEAIEQAVKIKKLSEVAFAPITVLTKPDRPDNWVIFNKPSEEPLLPQPPAVSTGTGAEPTVEVPMPFYSLRSLKRTERASTDPLEVSKIDAKFP